MLARQVFQLERRDRSMAVRENDARRAWREVRALTAARVVTPPR